MADRILWAKVADPKTAVASVAWPSPAFMYLERLPLSWLGEDEIAAGVRLEAFDPAADFSHYERGRVFCAEFELRWEWVENGFAAILVGAAPAAPGFTAAAELDVGTATVEPHEYYLWGLRVEDSDLAVAGVERAGRGEPYLEMRIPRVLRYPVGGDKRQTVVTTCEYVDPGTGATLHYRLTGVEERG